MNIIILFCNFNYATSVNVYKLFWEFWLNRAMQMQHVNLFVFVLLKDFGYATSAVNIREC